MKVIKTRETSRQGKIVVRYLVQTQVSADDTPECEEQALKLLRQILNEPLEMITT